MRIYELKMNNNGLSLNQQLEGIEFAGVEKSKNDTIENNDKTVKEEDVKRLIMKNEHLLNYDTTETDGKQDLLIIGTEVTTKRRNRCDLLAIDREGYLITIEIKRDLIDAQRRNEPCEFQAIRYAAAHSTMTKENVIEFYANYLQENKPNEDGDDWENVEDWYEEAKKRIYEHIDRANTDDQEENQEPLSPSEKQKIFLVASDFEPECLSACAWLKIHQIDIHCIKIQPYKVSVGDKSTYILIRERLVPTKQLDNYLERMKEYKDKIEANNKRNTNNDNYQPQKIELDGREKTIKSWARLYGFIVKFALEKGLEITKLPNYAVKTEEERDNLKKKSPSFTFEAVEYTDPKTDETATVYINQGKDAKSQLKRCKEVQSKLGKKCIIKITLETGDEYELSQITEEDIKK